MTQNLSDYRKSYEKGALIEGNLPETPFELFTNWFQEVEASKGVEEVNAMTISTIGADGFPKNRVVLLKSYSEKGFVFYTNYNSEKGKALALNPKISISFFWPNLERQVIIKGVAEKLSETQSQAYFNVRPKGSQIGAWASPQSEVINSRNVLEQNVIDLKKKYTDKAISKPDFWGGYIIKPISIEFWQGRPNRLHDRMLYELTAEKWICNRLAP